jgi:hypothetical protein
MRSASAFSNDPLDESAISPTIPRRVAIELAVATLLLLLPALINGYPLVYPDTGIYILQAIEHAAVAERPPYYSHLILLIHLKLSLWPVIAMQCLAVATALWLVLHALVPFARASLYFFVTVMLTAFTSVGWLAGQVMPDIFTGLLTITVFLIAWAWEGRGLPARATFVIAACVLTTLHYTFLPLAIGLFAVAALIRSSQGAGWRDACRVAATGAAVATVAASAFVWYSLQIIHRPVLAPSGTIFLAGRVLADGPGREWLAANCPASGNPFCKYQDRLPTSTYAFLWSPSSSLVDVTREVGPEQTRRAATQIVVGAIALHPGAELSAALANSWSQLVHFGTLDTDCPENCRETDLVSITIKRYFPREYGQFRNSLQITGRLPKRAIRRLDSPFVTAALLIDLLLLVVALRDGDGLTTAFILMVATTLVVNAILCGALSDPTDRYQSRVVWLLPLSAMLGLGRLWALQRASRPVTGNETFAAAASDLELLPDSPPSLTNDQF